MRVSYVNGLYVPHSDAALHVDDRGTQFADAVYEVLPVVAGRLRHAEHHLDRLERSLGALRIGWPVSRRVLPVILAEVVRRNGFKDGIVYLQISRGAAKRNHVFPTADLPSSLVVSAWPVKGPSAKAVEEGIAVITLPDRRWGSPYIKTVGLLANVLDRQQAKEAGAYEAWLVNEAGKVTEGAATNAFIITKDGTILTHPATNAILGGVTRQNLITLARDSGLKLEERAFTVAEAKTAAEAFLTGTTVMVMPVVRIDGDNVGNGRPGPLTLRLRALYQEMRSR